MCRCKPDVPTSEPRGLCIADPFETGSKAFRPVRRSLPSLSGSVWLGASALLLVLAVWWSGRPAPRVPMTTIGIVQLTTVDAATVEGFKAHLAELGYREGRNVRYRYPGPAGSIERLAPIIADHLAAGVDLLLVSSTPAAVAAQAATAHTAVPVVFAPVNDPVKAGVVTGLQSPGGNLTGVRLPQGDAIRLQWLVKLAPQVRKILFPHNPNDPSALESLRQIQAVSAALGITLMTQPLPTAEAMEAALRAPPQVDAILLPRDSSVEARIADYVALARERKIPLCAPSLTQVHAGALVSYGFVHYAIGRQAARMAHQILSGTPPGDLPVETALSSLAINLRTAQTIGLSVPPQILRSAHTIVR
jgi:putative ABC transport system substrate-binding protein